MIVSVRISQKPETIKAGIMTKPAEDAQHSRKQRPVTFDPKLELFQDNLQLVTLTFGIVLYTDALFSENANAINACYDRFLSLCPESELRFYATENMRRHKPVTKRALAMLPTWLKPGAPPREYFAIELKNGQAYQDAPTFSFKVCGGEPGSTLRQSGQPNMVKMAFPAQWGSERSGDMLKLVQDLCSFFPFKSGLAGFSFECSRYASEASQSHAWAASMRHPGIDIPRIPEDGRALGQDGLKGVGWLTILGNYFVNLLGGVESIRRGLSNDIEILEVSHGVILRAGAAPALGDVNSADRLPLYREIYRLLASWIGLASERTLAFNLAENYVERTERWFKRLADE